MPRLLPEISSHPKVFIAAALCAFFSASPALTETDSSTSEEEAPSPEQLFTTQAAHLVFGDPPSISQKTFNISVQYTHIAKGFWIEERCGFLPKYPGGAELASNLNKKIAATTKMMRLFLAQEDGYSEDAANKETQKLQMYALNEMSAKSFYLCDQNAWKILTYASKEADIWVQTTAAVKSD